MFLMTGLTKLTGYKTFRGLQLIQYMADNQANKDNQQPDLEMTTMNTRYV